MSIQLIVISHLKTRFVYLILECFIIIIFFNVKVVLSFYFEKRKQKIEEEKESVIKKIKAHFSK